jgi:hypothetical protein
MRAALEITRYRVVLAKKYTLQVVYKHSNHGLVLGRGKYICQSVGEGAEAKVMSMEFSL